MAAPATEEDTSSAGARAGAATVKVQLKAAPGTPLMKVAKFRAPADQPFAFIVNFIRAQVKTPDVFCYLKSSFVPSPELTVQSLFESFKTGDELIITYAISPTFG